MMTAEQLTIALIPLEEFNRIQDAQIEKFDKLQLIADMCRLNTFSSVKLAGSGHLGASFSAMDILVSLYFSELNTAEVGRESPGRDIYFSSKGHDAPAHYAVLAACGILPFDKLKRLRRLGGLDGHPDVRIPGIEANSGSLGMGISKAKGIDLGKRLSKNPGRTFVMTGDGELQEGQIWEALQTASHQRYSNIHVIVDYNKVQTDRLVKDIIDLRDLEEKFTTFGWHVQRCDGHNFLELDKVFGEFRKIQDKPKILIADTIKGKGISFMEHPQALAVGAGLYRWHAGAPDDDAFEKGYKELIEKINTQLHRLELAPLAVADIETRQKGRVRFKDTAEKIVQAYGQALVELGEKRKDIIVLDADLACDCGLRPFEDRFPERFIENGIAEQDMVSMAGGLALQGYLPVVNSFSVFLAARATEQIYNNATELSKIIYVCHFAGMIPAGPGKSHQGVRDISLFQSLPNMIILEPGNAGEAKMALEYCVERAKTNCMIRLTISPSPRRIELPVGYRFSFGKGAVLHEGKEAIIFAYGPVMLHEALIAAEVLSKDGLSLKVVNLPWLNRVDSDWLKVTIAGYKNVFILDNHFIRGGLGDFLINVACENHMTDKKRFFKFGLEEYPECGRPDEVLRYHKLDGRSLADRIKQFSD
jgi:transketolase